MTLVITLAAMVLVLGAGMDAYSVKRLIDESEDIDPIAFIPACGYIITRLIATTILLQHALRP